MRWGLHDHHLRSENEGCGDSDVRAAAYTEITPGLALISIMARRLRRGVAIITMKDVARNYLCGYKEQQSHRRATERISQKPHLSYIAIDGLAITSEPPSVSSPRRRFAP